MKFSILEFYLEPGVSMDVPPEIKEQSIKLINRALLKTDIINLKPEWTYTLNVIPSKKHKNFFIGKPTILRSKKENFYTSFFPYKEIQKVKGENISLIYIKYLLETLSGIYEKETKKTLDQWIKDTIYEKLVIQAKKTPVLKDDGKDDFL